MPEVAGFIGKFNRHLALALGLLKNLHHTAFALFLCECIHKKNSLSDPNGRRQRQKAAVETHCFSGGDAPKRMVAGCPAIYLNRNLEWETLAASAFDHRKPPKKDRPMDRRDQA